MAELTAIAVAADITARLSAQAYNRLYAKNGGSSVDTAFRDLCLAEANNKFRSMTRAAFPSGVYADTDTVDPAIVGCVVDLCNDIAASRHLSVGAHGNGPVRTHEIGPLCERTDRMRRGSVLMSTDPPPLLGGRPSRRALCSVHEPQASVRDLPPMVPT